MAAARGHGSERRRGPYRVGAARFPGQGDYTCSYAGIGDITATSPAAAFDLTALSPFAARDIAALSPVAGGVITATSPVAVPDIAAASSASTRDITAASSRGAGTPGARSGRHALLRAAEAPAAGALRRVLSQQRAVLGLIVQGIALRVAQETAVAPGSARAGRTLEQLEQRLCGLAGAASEVSGWLERYRPLLRQLGEATLERAQREPKQEAAPKRSRRLVEALEEVAWRHFDTEAEAARWAEQNGPLIDKLD